MNKETQEALRRLGRLEENVIRTKNLELYKDYYYTYGRLHANIEYRKGYIDINELSHVYELIEEIEAY